MCVCRVLIHFQFLHGHDVFFKKTFGVRQLRCDPGEREQQALDTEKCDALSPPPVGGKGTAVGAERT